VGGADQQSHSSSARNSFLRAGWPCCWGVDSKLLEEGKSGSCRAGLECCLTEPCWPGGVALALCRLGGSRQVRNRNQNTFGWRSWSDAY
jgi:hypothetical protein